MARKPNPVLALNTRDLIVDNWHMGAKEFGEYCLSVFQSAMEGRWDDIQHPFRVSSKGICRPSVRPADRKAVLSAGICAHCKSTERLTVDHVVPLSRGGLHHLDNFQCLCFPCNRRKYSRLEEELG